MENPPPGLKKII